MHIALQHADAANCSTPLLHQTAHQTTPSLPFASLFPCSTNAYGDGILTCICDVLAYQHDLSLLWTLCCCWMQNSTPAHPASSLFPYHILHFHALFDTWLQYYTPAILELAGFRDNRTALLVAMLPAAVNSAGTLIGMWQIDKCGRRCCCCMCPALHCMPCCAAN